jgi:hypothetical protein
MEHYYNIQLIGEIDPVFKKKVTLKDRDITYTVVSADLPKALANQLSDDEDEYERTEESVIGVAVSPAETIRSIIVNEDESRLLSFSLPKSVPINVFEEKYETLNDPKFIITEIIEGTMVNLWWDSQQDKWEISTKKAVSGNYTYFKNPLVKKQKTFKEMFTDVVGDFEANHPPELNKNMFYSFVLKHPDNHIVQTVLHPTLYLVAVYEKTDDWQVKYIPQTTFMNCGIFPNAGIKYPRMFKNVTTYDSIYAEIERQNINTGNAIAATHCRDSLDDEDDDADETNYMVGVMITNTETGTRTKIENNVYKYLKELRGNHPSYKYKYYELIFSNRFGEFICFFPRYTELFMKFEEEFNTFVNSIYWYYVNRYIIKKPELSNGTIPYQYSFHINHLHYNIYLPFLKAGQKKKITRNFVYEYVWDMPIKSILYWLNYETIMENKNKH